MIVLLCTGDEDVPAFCDVRTGCQPLNKRPIQLAVMPVVNRGDRSILWESQKNLRFIRLDYLKISRVRQVLTINRLLLGDRRFPVLRSGGSDALESSNIIIVTQSIFSAIDCTNSVNFLANILWPSGPRCTPSVGSGETQIEVSAKRQS